MKVLSAWGRSTFYLIAVSRAVLSTPISSIFKLYFDFVRMLFYLLLCIFTGEFGCQFHGRPRSSDVRSIVIFGM